MNLLVMFGVGVLLSFVFRAALVWTFGRAFKQGFSGDSSVHWALIKATKENPNFTRIDQYLISEEPVSYPRLFHRIAAFLPLRFIEKYPWLPNLLIFSIAGGIFAAFVYEVSQDALVSPLLSALVATFLFNFSVCNLTVDGPALAYLGLSERLLGRLLTSFYFIFMAVGATKTGLTFFVLASVSGAAAMLTAKFARQAILFTTAAAAALSFSLFPLAVFSASFILAWVLGQDTFIKSLHFQFRHLYAYFKKIRNSAVSKNALTSFAKVSDFRGHSSLKSWLSVFLHKEPSRLLVRHPEIAAILWFGLFFDGYQVEKIYWVILFATLLVYFLTTTDKLNFLGESYRYVEYNIALLAPHMMASYFAPTGKYSVIAWYLLYVAIITVVIGYYERRRSVPLEDELKKFLGALGLTSQNVVFPVSMRLGADIVARCNAKSFWWQPGNVSESILRDFVEEYPFLRKDWEVLKDKYEISHVIVDKRALKKMGWSYNFKGLFLLKESKNYVAYSVNSPYGCSPTKLPLDDTSGDGRWLSAMIRASETSG